MWQESERLLCSSDNNLPCGCPNQFYSHKLLGEPSCVNQVAWCVVHGLVLAGTISIFVRALRILKRIRPPRRRWVVPRGPMGRPLRRELSEGSNSTANSRIDPKTTLKLVTVLLLLFAAAYCSLHILLLLFPSWWGYGELFPLFTASWALLSCATTTVGARFITILPRAVLPPRLKPIRKLAVFGRVFHFFNSLLFSLIFLTGWLAFVSLKAVALPLFFLWMALLSVSLGFILIYCCTTIRHFIRMAPRRSRNLHSIYKSCSNVVVVTSLLLSSQLLYLLVLYSVPALWRVPLLAFTLFYSATAIAGAHLLMTVLPEPSQSISRTLTTMRFVLQNEGGLDDLVMMVPSHQMDKLSSNANESPTHSKHRMFENQKHVTLPGQDGFVVFPQPLDPVSNSRPKCPHQSSRVYLISNTMNSFERDSKGEQKEVCTSEEMRGMELESCATTMRGMELDSCATTWSPKQDKDLKLESCGNLRMDRYSSHEGDQKSVAKKMIG